MKAVVQVAAKEASAGQVTEAAVEKARTSWRVKEMRAFWGMEGSGGAVDREAGLAGSEGQG